MREILQPPLIIPPQGEKKPKKPGSFSSSVRRKALSEAFQERRPCPICGQELVQGEPINIHHKFFIEYANEIGFYNYNPAVISSVQNAAPMHVECHDSFHNMVDAPPYLSSMYEGLNIQPVLLHHGVVFLKFVVQRLGELKTSFERDIFVERLPEDFKISHMQLPKRR